MRNLLESWCSKGSSVKPPQDQPEARRGERAVRHRLGSPGEVTMLLLFCKSSVVKKGGPRLYGLIRSGAGAFLLFAYDERAMERQHHGLAFGRATADPGEHESAERSRFRARQATVWEVASLGSARVTVSPITTHPQAHGSWQHDLPPRLTDTTLISRAGGTRGTGPYNQPCCCHSRGGCFSHHRGSARSIHVCREPCRREGDARSFSGTKGQH